MVAPILNSLLRKPLIQKKMTYRFSTTLRLLNSEKNVGKVMPFLFTVTGIFKAENDTLL